MLRKLQMTDADKMLEWMHDKNVVQNLQTNFQDKTIEDCKRFIAENESKKQDLHYAIADCEGRYLGTVSLKNIDLEEGCAEFAIVISSQGMGKGYSREAMEEILKIGFREYALKRIYWCVSKENRRALKFYRKNGYEIIGASALNVPKGYTMEQINDYVWFQINI